MSTKQANTTIVSEPFAPLAAPLNGKKTSIHEQLDLLDQQLSVVFWSTTDADVKRLIGEQREALTRMGNDLFRKKITLSNKKWEEAAGSINLAKEAADEAAKKIDNIMHCVRAVAQVLSILETILKIAA